VSARLTAVLVDDEAPARERLTDLLAAHPQIEIVGQAEDVASAADLCARLRPALLFLDVQLRGEQGFDLLPHLTYAPEVVFVTAHDRYAVRAFEVNALDYLLKPVHPDRLAAALKRLGAAERDDRPASRLAESDLVSLRTDRGLRVVPLLSITHIEADENYTRVHVKGSAPAFVRRAMSEWEQLLPDGQFLRLTRSLIVQLRAVREVRPLSRDEVQVVIAGQAEPVTFARRAALRLRQALKSL